MEELKSLVTRAQSGSVDAYAEVVRRFQDMAFGCAYATLGDFHLAEDAAQEAFIGAYYDLDALRDPAAFPGWLRRIVLKHCDRLTRRRRGRTTPLESAHGVSSDCSGPPEAAERREMADRVLDAIRTLPEHERMATTLFYINGYSQKEVAEFLEVPVTTVNNRLHASRKRLKERMIAMVDETLKEHALPAGFTEMIKKLILFPQREPRIEVGKSEQRSGSLRFMEGGFLEPLEEGGEAVLAWYDWPERNLTGTACPRVIGKEKVAGLECYRVRIPDFDPHRRWVYDHEWYWAVKEGKLYFVAKANFEPGAAGPRLMTWDDADWDEERTGWPVELKLQSRVRWNSDTCGRGPRFPRIPVVAGTWQVRIGDYQHECLRALNLRYIGRRQGSKLDELAQSYRTLAEYFVGLDGRSVLMRRYNGPAWPRESRGALDVLRKKGCPELRYNGVEFRLWYDCIPLRALNAE
ncbi:MAG: RNA polymerase sigma factor [Planctomycetota bacterium]|jgi:RNA polymerase sigma factor (sigma-70 family)